MRAVHTRAMETEMKDDSVTTLLRGCAQPGLVNERVKEKKKRGEEEENEKVVIDWIDRYGAHLKRVWSQHQF